MSTQHSVSAGECINSIAEAHGFFPATLWDHADNAGLRRVRGNPDVLLAGDVVAIPEKRPREESCATGRVHRFRRRGVPAYLEMRFSLDGRTPYAGQPWEVEIDGAVTRGTTDAAGGVRIPVPAGARGGTLRLGAEAVEFPLRLGTLDPPDADSGLRARLTNLGYPCGAVDGPLDDAARGALRAFQADRGLPATGEPDAATRAALVRAHGS